MLEEKVLALQLDIMVVVKEVLLHMVKADQVEVHQMYVEALIL